MREELKSLLGEGCIDLPPYTAEQWEDTPYTVANHAAADAYGKANGLTVTFAAWRPDPRYRLFKTGTLLSRNEEYPSGLVLIDEKGRPHPYNL